MNIGYLYGFPAYPPQGGHATHAYQLVRWFVRRGHVVHTIGDSSLRLVRNYGTTTSFDLDSFLRGIDVLYIRVDGWYLRDDPLKQLAMQRARVPIVWEINSPANEMLAFSYLGAATNGSRLPRPLMNLKRRLHAWRQLPAIYREESVRRRYARTVQAAICVSSAIERYAREGLGIGRTCVIPNGADPELSNPERAPATIDPRFRDWFKVVYAGSPKYPWQGLDIMRQLVASFDKTREKILFMLMVNQLTSQIPRGDNVLVLEQVPYRDVPSYVRAADVCLCLCRDFTWSRWGFHGSPTKLFDYMACAKPVIASRVGQLEAVIEDGIDGVLVENSAEDITKKILHLRETRVQLGLMGARARDKALRYYNWERAADATLDVLTSVASA